MKKIGNVVILNDGTNFPLNLDNVLTYKRFDKDIIINGTIIIYESETNAEMDEQHLNQIFQPVAIRDFAMDPAITSKD